MTDTRLLLTVCSDGNLELLKKHIRYAERRGRSIRSVVNTPTSSGQTVLIAACRTGKSDIVRYLVDDCGADIEQVGTVHFDGEAVEGVTPLWCAAAANYIDIVRFLVDRGADVNRTTITNSTSLRAACFDGHEEVVRYLVEKGANVETPNRHEHTCLMIACFRGHENIVKYLLSKGARVNRRSARGNTALHDCVESGNLRSLVLLLRYGALMRPDEYGQTPIISGATSAYKKIVDYLCELRSPAGDYVVPIEEQAAATNFLALLSMTVQDAVIEWQYAMNLRRTHFGYTKRLPPVSEDARNHYAWSLIEDTARNAVAMEISRKKRREGNYNLTVGEVERGFLNSSSVPLPSTITADHIWACKHTARHVLLAQQYEKLLLAQHQSKLYSCTNWMSEGVKSPEQNLRSAVDAVLGVEPEFYPRRSRHIRRPLEGVSNDVTLRAQSSAQASEEHRLRYFSVPEEMATRGAVDPCEILDAAEEKLRGEESYQSEPQLIRRLRHYSLSAFGQVREFGNFLELKQVTQDAYALPLQSLLIRLRILGPDHPDTIYFLRYRGATYADAGAFPPCLAFWRYAIELQRVFLDPLSYVSQSSFLAFAELYNIILSNRYSGLRAVRLQPSLIIDSIELVIDNIEGGMEYSYPHWHGRTPWAYTSADKEATNLHRHVRLCLHFIALLAYYFCSPETRTPPLHRQRLEALRLGPGGAPTSAPIFSGAFPLLETPSEATGTLSDIAEPIEESPAPTAWNTFVPSESEHAEMRKKMTPSLMERFFRQVNRLVRLNPRVHEDATPLHMAASCSRLVRCDLLPLPHADLLRLLTALGADPDAVDACGHRPIGQILASHALSDPQKAELIATLVLYCGAHFDACVMPPILDEEEEGETLDKVEAMDDDPSHSMPSRSVTYTPSFRSPIETLVPPPATVSTDEVDEIEPNTHVVASSSINNSTSISDTVSAAAATTSSHATSSSPVTTSANRFTRSATTYSEAAMLGLRRANSMLWPWGRGCSRILVMSGLQPLRHVNLQCLAARALPRSQHNRLPEHLLEFVRLHHCQHRPKRRQNRNSQMN